ncbi:MAG: hypothetical protein QW348_02925 [Ignisphaera sp.]
MPSVLSEKVWVTTSKEIYLNTISKAISRYGAIDAVSSNVSIYVVKPGFNEKAKRSFTAYIEMSSTP